MQNLNSFKLLCLFLAVTLLSTTHVAAGGCNGCSSGPCGRVENNSGRNMLYTTNPNTDLGAHAGRCHFWNWYDTPWNLDRVVSCTHQTLANGAGKGGCRERIDVDGFTFASNAYWVFGTRHNAGVWTKITNVQKLVCRKILGQYICSA